jgi:hypothetical protein
MERPRKNGRKARPQRPNGSAAEPAELEADDPWMGSVGRAF